MTHVAEIKSVKELKEFLKGYFKGAEIEVYLFGSRAQGNSSRFSDIDIGFLSNRDISGELSILRELLDESNIPYKVDIVDLSENNDLKKAVLKEGKRWL